MASKCAGEDVFSRYDRRNGKSTKQCSAPLPSGGCGGRPQDTFHAVAGVFTNNSFTTPTGAGIRLCLYFFKRLASPVPVRTARVQ